MKVSLTEPRPTHMPLQPKLDGPGPGRHPRPRGLARRPRPRGRGRRAAHRLPDGGRVRPILIAPSGGRRGRGLEPHEAAAGRQVRLAPGARGQVRLAPSARGHARPRALPREADARGRRTRTDDEPQTASRCNRHGPDRTAHCRGRCRTLWNTPEPRNPATTTPRPGISADDATSTETAEDSTSRPDSARRFREPAPESTPIGEPHRSAVEGHDGGDATAMSRISRCKQGRGPTRHRTGHDELDGGRCEHRARTQETQTRSATGMPTSKAPRPDTPPATQSGTPGNRAVEEANTRQSRENTIQKTRTGR